MFPKPEPWKRVKARRKRQEARHAGEVRADVERRDGYCRLRGSDEFGPCGGASEWAHLGDKRRFKTRGMAPEDRHTTADSLMLCTRHHQDGPFAYDRNRMTIEKMTTEGADGPLRFKDKAGERLLEETIG
jgi:hypothetical protein